MIAQFAYSIYFGLPVVAYAGIITLLLLLTTATLGYLSLYRNIQNGFKLHFFFARITIAFALIHAILAISAYLKF
ncbi:MAG: hypothetical protein UX02_C0001G0341 [Candidatus Moranbacteria bacterium GW2011_GWC1_45_18]|nr:MAG: hypothetical protein UT79_C0002G0056 [Candidatus Moranbacteria bacterium GW2011_GWC2_40_12]KKT33794.1 MAG: hypothetical protein UW19_C0005G0040 [Candidatus Moranbacteria bacterium GW2011_GWF2_44_10]KKT70088.1 MAG: hypothetical protein UW66_C0052G0004 [Candidatus Moranbacteria bacterium GW2011_GWF1_44_4]KKU00893.1 MAG: hypothetical protein UX02_C0001G0341 [Candidatus Moranbacteria bacterium GW2011_GWC1_45_18]OGI23458.1 MAG: hypothetical protein A2194_03595 [Candidatus Moranbacteria bacte